MAIKPYARPDVLQEDIEAVCDVLKSQYLTTGPKVDELEAVFCGLVDAPFSVASSNGTTALHLACLALGLKEGDLVLVPAMTFLATANAVRMCGADVVFCDVDPETGIVRLEDIIKAQNKVSPIDQVRIKAVFVVHIGGHCADMPKISEYVVSQGWKLIEDACHALGGTHVNAKVGSCVYSDIASFSLHATKCFTSGEGGMTTTKDAELALKMKTLRNHGMTRDPETGPWAYKMQDLGYNYRLSDIQCALAISQLKRFDQVRQRRKEIVQKYRSAFDGFSDVFYPVPATHNGDEVLHLFQILIDFERLGKTRAAVQALLLEKEVGTQVHYIPVCDQPYYKGLYGICDAQGARSFYQRVLALPLYVSLNDEEVGEIIGYVQSVLAI